MSRDDGSHAYRSCQRKKKYSTEALALEVAHANQRRKPSLKLYAYLCAICSCYHLTSHPRRGRHPVVAA